MAWALYQITKLLGNNKTASLLTRQPNLGSHIIFDLTASIKLMQVKKVIDAMYAIYTSQCHSIRVPQGSVVGPILFTLNVIDVINSVDIK